MTEPLDADMLTGNELDGLCNKGLEHMSVDLQVTRRNAEIRSPLTGEYNLAEVMEEVLGRESATCEACQKTVYHGKGGDLEQGEPFVLRELVENVYTLENQVLLCDTCAQLPPEAWRADVREKRAREQDSEPTLVDHIDHWLSDPTARSLFARRVAGTFVAAGALVASVTIIAGIAGGLAGGSATGTAWSRTVLETVWTAGATLVASPWIVGGLVAVGYASHTIERVRNDPRGYLPRDRPPWIPLTVAGVLSGLGAVGVLGTTGGLLPAAQVALLLAGAIWTIGAVGVAWYIDPALRHDLHDRIWNPDRRLWLIAARVGIIPGVFAITVGVPFESMLPETTTAVFAAIPAGVALAYTGRRLPHDPEARDAILEALPDQFLGLLENSE